MGTAAQLRLNEPHVWAPPRLPARPRGHGRRFVATEGLGLSPGARHGGLHPAARGRARELARRTQAACWQPVGVRVRVWGAVGGGVGRLQPGAVNQVTDLINFVPGGFFSPLFLKNQRKQNIFLIK